MRIWNLTGRFGQVLCSLVLAFRLIAVTVAWQSGPPERLAADWNWPLLADFGIRALGVLVHSNRSPAIILEIRDEDDITLSEATLLRQHFRTIRTEDVSDITVSEGEDDDGYPCIRADLMLADETQAVIAEGHCREGVERIASKVSTAMGRE